ncbi:MULTISPECIES: MDR family MFS transporter [Pantoea]|jgi:EmrB/QacA subfamily drug resistance transporter|uniref:EmrB/QacA family drug resistance transporter n=1 Tax=Pantoea brenneri TaxID=472694 RepID=A0A654AG06_9GAMM|nr:MULTISPECIES: MDR family MFS transporter [Pantoea]MBS6031663.1 MFS transporter [Pantoea sp.]MBZ6393654.1 MFS transporter [Pantoea sp.]MBZ6437363.1 MFS transporter [Pantoea sp.]MCQ5469588.1 MFS transporter [Pantoea brenneri]MDH1086428.1 MFS transporter [Pantoea brenneri]
MTESAQLQTGHRHWILIACMLAMFMAAIEVTIVATAMPTIIAELGGFSQFGWVFSIYLLTQAVSVPLYGRLADLYGRKMMFFIGTAIFLIGSVLCGFAHSMTWLILFRAFQGLGAGAIMPLSSTIVADIYSPRERASVQGWLSSVWGVAAIVGPLTGAWLVQHFSWSVIFWVNLPIGLISMLMLARWLPAHQQEQQRQSLNLAGSGWLMLCVSALLVALLQAEQLGLWLIPFLLFSLFAGWMLKRHEQRADAPLFPLIIWRSRLIIAGNAGNLIIGAAMMGISAFLPTWIQGIGGGSPLQAGSALAMMSIGWPLASTLSGRLMLRTSYRFTAQSGALLLISGSALLLLLRPDSSLYQAGFTAFVIGTGMGMTSTTFLVSVQNQADYEIRGICTASIMFSRMIGSAIGTAIMGAVLNLNLHWRLPQAQDPVQQIMADESRRQLTPETLQQMVQAIAASLHWVFVVALVIALFALGVAWMMPRQRPEHAE